MWIHTALWKKCEFSCPGIRLLFPGCPETIFVTKQEQTVNFIKKFLILVLKILWWLILFLPCPEPLYLTTQSVRNCFVKNGKKISRLDLSSNYFWPIRFESGSVITLATGGLGVIILTRWFKMYQYKKNTLQIKKNILWFVVDCFILGVQQIIIFMFKLQFRIDLRKHTISTYFD